MTSEGMKAFASYFLSQEDRGLEKGSSSTYGYLDGNISKFGVGATQAVRMAYLLSVCLFSLFVETLTLDLLHSFVSIIFI